MYLIKLNAIGSTNSYLRQICTKKVLQDFTVVMTTHQTKGRGQMGTHWMTQKGKNLTISIYKLIPALPLEKGFYISMAASLAIIRTLQRFNIPRLHLKWPNDILSEDKKICGILIENLTKNGKIESSILGIGLNVNQAEFRRLPKASSLKIITGRIFDKEELLQLIIDDLKVTFKKLENGDFRQLKREYEGFLFRKNKPSTFKDNEGNMFPGYIKGVNESGQLRVLTEDNIIREFDLKGVELLY